MAKKRVAVALSGGVDSAATAFLLQEAGYEVVGMAMRLGQEEEIPPAGRHRSSRSAPGIREAEQVCLALGIPLHIINLENEFKQYVVDYFREEYIHGRTPNPCITCNRDMKFGFLLNKALSMGVDYMATGHYARIKYFDDKYHLLKGADSKRDQSYMLYTLEQHKLDYLLFPLGDYGKGQVRELARQRNLPGVDRRDSQDICFIRTDHGSLPRHPDATPGEIVDGHGKVLGKHKGVAFYTIGQRHGLGVAAGEPLYVTRIEPDANRLRVGRREELFSSRLTASMVNWISGTPPARPIEITARIRYASPEAAATLYPGAHSVEVQFYHPQWAITPGQAIVFYRDSEVLGGGTIEK